MNTQKYIIKKFNNKLFVNEAITIGHSKEANGFHHCRHLVANQLERKGALPFFVFNKQRLFLNYLFKHHTFLKIQDQKNQADALPFRFAYTKRLTVISETLAGFNKLKKIFSKSIFENNINVLYFHNAYIPADRVLYADSDSIKKIKKENFCSRPSWLTEEASTPESKIEQSGDLTPVLTFSVYARTLDRSAVPASVDNFFNIFNSNFLFLSSGSTRKDNTLFELSKWMWFRSSTALIDTNSVAPFVYRFSGEDQDVFKFFGNDDNIRVKFFITKLVYKLNEKSFNKIKNVSHKY